MAFEPHSPPGPPVPAPPGLRRAFRDVPPEIESWLHARGLKRIEPIGVIDPWIVEVLYESDRERIVLYFSSDLSSMANLSERILWLVKRMTSVPLKYMENVSGIQGWDWAMKNRSIHYLVRNNLALEIPWGEESADVAQALGALLDDAEALSPSALVGAVPPVEVVTAPPSQVQVGRELVVAVKSRPNTDTAFHYPTDLLREVDIDGAGARFMAVAAGKARITSCQRPQDGLRMVCAGFDVEVIE